MELTIESLAAGGDGVARAPDGRVVFVPFTAPGDRIRARVTEERKRYLRARVEALLAPGPGRVDPVCPVFGSCGGCSWQHVEPSVQREAKARLVADALTRIGGLAWGGEIRVMPSPEAYGYRGRTRLLALGREGRVGYRRRRSHRIQAVSRCPVLLPALDRALHALAGDPGRLAAGGAAGETEWELAAAGDGLRVAPLDTGSEGGRDLELPVRGDRLRISPGVFFQSNALLHDALAGSVAGAAGSGESALEVFAGAGFFTLGLARAFRRVTAVEAHPAAAADLRHNLARAGCENVEVRASPLEALWDVLPKAEVLVLDPPRSGLPEGAAERLARVEASRIVYLSCDPATWARDLARFAARGYTLDQVEAFDLFPQTPHVEVLARLVA